MSKKLLTEIPEEYEGPPPSPPIDIVKTFSNGAEHHATCTEDDFPYWKSQGYRRVEEPENTTS